MDVRRLAWLSGTGVVLLLLVSVAGLYLKKRYCWDCTADERYAYATELLCDSSEKDRRRGVDQVCKAAGQGHPEAQALAGELFLQPLPGRYVSIHQDLFECAASGVSADPERARRFFTNLARSGKVWPEMEFNLGVLIEDGILVPPRADKGAEDYFRSAAEQGESRAMFELGMNEDSQQRYGEAARWFKESFSRGGHPGAALMLGDYAFYGRLGGAELDRAITWYQKAVEAVQNPEFSGIAAAIAQRADQRLAIAGGFQRRSAGQSAIAVSYRLAGGLNEYRVYAGDPEFLLGRVMREAGVVVAIYQNSDGDAEYAERRDLASMNDGLNWLLETYAGERYGAGKRFRFVLAAE